MAVSFVAILARLKVCSEQITFYVNMWKIFKENICVWLSHTRVNVTSRVFIIILHIGLLIILNYRYRSSLNKNNNNNNNVKKRRKAENEIREGSIKATYKRFVYIFLVHKVWLETEIVSFLWFLVLFFICMLVRFFIELNLNPRNALNNMDVRLETL